jgi:hypothetical protein
VSLSLSFKAIGPFLYDTEQNDVSLYARILLLFGSLDGNNDSVPGLNSNNNDNSHRMDDTDHDDHDDESNPKKEQKDIIARLHRKEWYRNLG